MNKDDMIRVRADEAEKTMFRRAAALAGLSLSAWMRERLRSAALKELRAANRSVAA